MLPFLNERRFLAGAVETVREQSMTDWELLLVDDGSTDGSARLAEDCAADDPARIRVLRHPGGANRGLPASRNLGVREARAPTLAFLDADDRWMPHKLAAQLEVLDRFPDAGMTCSPTWYRHEVDGRDVLTPVVVDAPRRFARGDFARALMSGMVDPPPPSNVMFRTDALRDVGGVPDGDNLYEDQRTFYAVNLAFPVHVTESPLSVYTVRPDSLFGSLADADDVKWQQREDFERWTVAWGSRRSLLGARLGAETAARRVAGRVRWRMRRRVLSSVPERYHARLRSLVRRIRRGHVRFGSLRRLTPIAGNWGLDRGQPVDRYFIERFIERHRQRIRGRVLEVQRPDYTLAYGTGVEHYDVLDIDAANPEATLIADLRVVGSLPAGRYDCVIVTQTLQFVDNLHTAVSNLWRSLAPGGTLLVTMPTVSKLEATLADVECWRVTPHGLDQVLRRACPGGEIDVEGYGNILVSTSFLYGLVTEDLRRHELDHYDPIFPTGACGRATKPPS